MNNLPSPRAAIVMLNAQDIGYLYRPDLSTSQVQVWQAPSGELREWEAKGKPMVAVEVENDRNR
jgi:hypothetical protein